MPYTPPLHRSPSSSVASSPPELSRRSSLYSVKSTTSTSTHATLPRSSSYLTRHRRTPSAVASDPAFQPTPPATSENLVGMVAVNHIHDENSSLRQSPPPVTGGRRIPNGAVISPPESPANGSDDDEPAPEKRGRQIEDPDELKQLHEAISQLPRRRETSPSETSDTGVPMVRPLPAADLIHHSFSTSSLDQLSRRSALIARSTSTHSNGRRVSHFRSATEPNVSASPCSSSLTGSDEEDIDPNFKPQMVRKKSGELVRPALRLGSRRRPSSMPGTPTFSKAVHFDSHLEHVRHFLQVDRPLAVSAGSSPVETYDSETEYPFGGDSASAKPVRRTPPFEWELTLTKFPIDSPARKALPVRLERVWLSPDQKSLLGSVAVQNLAFSKWVVCRFTMDYWKTTSEVAAEYSAEILPRVTPEGHDRFNFAIKLSDTANLENKTLYFCIRYNVDGKEFWDSNGGSNFQVDFKKKMLPINGKAGMRDGHSLPRSNRRMNQSSAQRPVSMPATLDEFGNGSNLMFDQSLQDYLGEPAPRLKSSQSTSSIPSDNLSNRLPTPSGQAFANRYDFGASLSAAMLAAKDSLANGKDALYMKPNKRAGIVSPPPSTKAATNSAANTSSSSAASTGKPPLAVNTSQQKPNTISLPVAALDRDSRAILAGSGALYGPGGIASKSYDEIVSKYCFYVPNQSSQPRDTAMHIGQIDGANGELVTQSQTGSPTSSSSEGSPLQMGGYYPHPPTAVRHSMTAGYHNNFGHSAVPTMSAKNERDQRPRSMEAVTMIAATAPSATNSTTSSSRSASPASPASMVGAFPPFAATPTPPADFAFQHMKERFPFVGADAHAAPAIRG